MSFSSSSSDCESDEYWQLESEHDKNYRNAYGKNPFYSTMGHPLLYYAQVPQPVSRKCRGRKRQRDGPNCFVKAFRWYTEEHVPNKNCTTEKALDMSGFATWLDRKYDQFLQESQMCSETCHLKQSTVNEPDRTKLTAYNEAAAPPKRYRFKSPWKRRQRAKSSDSQECRQRSNQSFHYILQPKDTSRPGSLCCNISNATLECSKKPLVKSCSFSNTTFIKKKEEKTDIISIPACEEIKLTAVVVDKKNSTRDFGCQYSAPSVATAEVGTQCDFQEPPSSSCITQRSVPNNDCGCQIIETQKAMPCTTVPSNESAPIPEQSDCQSLDRMPRTPTKKGAKTSPKSYKKKKSSSTVNHECQCPEESVVKADAQTQYDKGHSCLQTVSCECHVQELKPTSPPPVQSTSTTNLCQCEKKFMEELLKQRMCVVKLTQKTAQTSNHSICLDNRAVNQYPLFMKIICADKLSNERVKW